MFNILTGKITWDVPSQELSSLCNASQAECVQGKQMTSTSRGPSTEIEASISCPRVSLESNQYHPPTTAETTEYSGIEFPLFSNVENICSMSVVSETSSEDAENNLTNENIIAQLGATDRPLESPRKKRTKASVLKKLARNSGQGYSTITGKFIAAKEFKYQLCNCKYDCKVLSEIERKLIFNRFWATKCWQSQQNFIASSVTVSAAKRHYVKQSRRNYSRQFLLNQKRVCLKVFIGTLSITTQRLHYCITKKVQQNICSPDKRGKCTPNKTSNTKILEIREFLDSIPKYTSHYTKNEKLYFKEDLTKVKLFEEYKKKQGEECKISVSKPVFYRIFNEYNIGIYVPKTDTCQVCDAGAIKKKYGTEEEKAEIKKNLDLHLELAEKARDYLNLATGEAKGTSSLLVFTFDMQKNQPLPRLQTSVVFYKRQLWMLNVGINNRKDNQGVMAMWAETEGKRGAKEICSSIIAYLDVTDTSAVKRVKTFSDACGGQNRNKAIICFFMWLCDTRGFESWEHTYMESGHSYLPNDRDFSVIEKKAKGMMIHSKEEWMSLVQSSMVKRPFKIIDMHNKFLDVDQLLSNRKYCNTKTTDKKFNFLQLKSFIVRKNSPTITYTTSTSGPHQFTYPLINNSQPTSLQPSSVPNPISKEKYADLQSLLQYIPPVYHDFYKTLPHL